MEHKEKNSLLIVDDDPSNLMTLSYILQHDYIVHAALNGESAITMAERILPDLILLDIVMHGLDGYQVLIALQNTEWGADIPVIFITGLDNTDAERKGLIMGAADYISRPFDDMIVKLRVRHQIQIVNQMRAIERLSMLDRLTGIPNRRNFDNRLVVEWGRAIRDNAWIGLLMIDVDHFKHYNDRYGHRQGDAALCALARMLTQTSMRAVDFVARWGGEEFAILLPSSDIHGAFMIAERLRVGVANIKILCAEGELTNITVSIGINALEPNLDSSLDRFISKADKALYTAKNTGRNRVCWIE